jgi:hypothetical protein
MARARGCRRTVDRPPCQRCGTGIGDEEFDCGVGEVIISLDFRFTPHFLLV